MLETVVSLLRTFSESDEVLRRSKTGAVIAAGGSGSRMGGDVPKQLLALDGIPVGMRSLLAFERCAYISEIVLVSRREDIPTWERLCAEYGVTRLRKVVAGGETRQESVLRGFEALSPDVDFVAIHDAARCLITPDVILAVLRAAARYGGASAASPARDSFKRATDKGFIAETVERERLWHAQTPQIFRADLYCAAAYIARERGLEATDDNALVEAIGQPVKLVDTGVENLKITAPEDLALARAILHMRAEREESEEKEEQEKSSGSRKDLA